MFHLGIHYITFINNRSQTLILYTRRIVDPNTGSLVYAGRNSVYWSTTTYPNATARVLPPFQ